MMKTTTKIIVLILATVFFSIGTISVFKANNYADASNTLTISDNVHKLHCPEKGAAALSFKASNETYHLTTKFRGEYCNNEHSTRLLGQPVELSVISISEGFYQVLEMKQDGVTILSLEDVIAERNNSTLGLFVISFFLIALVLLKGRR